MKKAEMFDALLAQVFEMVDGTILGWHDQQVPINLAGMIEASPDEQFKFAVNFLAKGVKRWAYEKQSGSGVKTVEQAAQVVSWDNLKDLAEGTRVGGTRINSEADAAQAKYLSNLIKLLKDGKGTEFAATYGISLVEKTTEAGQKRYSLEIANQAEFDAYLAERLAKPDYVEIGKKEYARVQAERAAKTKKVGEASL